MKYLYNINYPHRTPIRALGVYKFSFWVFFLDNWSLIHYHKSFVSKIWPTFLWTRQWAASSGYCSDLVAILYFKTQNKCQLFNLVSETKRVTENLLCNSCWSSSWVKKVFQRSNESFLAQLDDQHESHNKFFESFLYRIRH